MQKSVYRPDIDGLRAVAVLLVLFFHLGTPGFTGGFIGVDVFFVISGFLITRLICSEVHAGHFNFAQFYARRARRLFPALFTTLVGCFVAAYFFFTPYKIKDFGSQLQYALLSISNYYFLDNSAYFDIAAESKPLLHTWSLSIEEQFYLVWPLTLFLLLRQKRKNLVIGSIVAVGLFSFILNIIYKGDPSRTFYLAKYRIFEFAIGAVLVWLPDHVVGKNIVKETLAFAGLGFILYAGMVYTKDTRFPSYAALIPCLGAAFVIVGGTAQYVGRLLRSRLMVSIGLISYSLYLVHWPIITFYKSATFKKSLLPIEQAVIFAVSFIVAICVYFLIEKTFRLQKKADSSWGPATVGFVCASLALLLTFPLNRMWAQNGWPERFKNKNIERYYTDVEFDDYVWERASKLMGPFSDSSKKKILVFGDSQGADFVNILTESGIDIEHGMDIRLYRTYSHCQAIVSPDEKINSLISSEWKSICRDVHKNVYQSSLFKTADTVVLAVSWADWALPYLQQTIEEIYRLGSKKVIVAGMKLQQESGVNILRQDFSDDHLLDRTVPIKQDVIKINSQLQNTKARFQYLDILSSFCSNSTCRAFTNQSQMIFYDRSHLSPAGARFIGRALANKGLLGL